MKLDVGELKRFVESTGIKQKYISAQTGIPESILSNILQGKRKCEVGEYASICAILDVPVERFITEEAG